MIDVAGVFAEMDRALAARGFSSEDEREHPEAFGSRWRLYRRTPREALSLTWDGKEGWMTLAGGIPWRELATVKASRDQRYDSAAVVSQLLGEASRIPDYDPAV